MTITFSNSDSMKAAKASLAKAMAEGKPEEQKEAFNTFFDALHQDVSAKISAQANDEILDRSILQNRGQNVLTSAETKFFKAAIDKQGFDENSILPETTQERIFEDLTQEHPLLNALQLKDMGAVTRIITADPTGAAVWGPLMGEILGQIGSSFKETKISQLKLTAFAVIPNDMLELGPVWVERYVRTLIVEVLSVGLERGFVIGTGVNQPIGLVKNFDEATGAISDKVSAGTLTFEPGRKTILELKNVVKALSVDAAGKARRVAGKIVMVVNPVDNFDIQASATVQNASGVYVTNLPFNPQIVESEFVTAGTVVFFVQGEYLAVIAGGYKLNAFNQTLAMEDAMLYTIKQFANGKPMDNNAAAVYTLAIADGTSAPATV